MHTNQNKLSGETIEKYGMLENTKFQTCALVLNMRIFKS